MANLNTISGFVSQLKALGFCVDNTSEPRTRRRFFGGYEYTTINFRINGIKVALEEKFGPHRIRYRGPIPLAEDPKKLTFFNHTLEAYETDEGQWIRTDQYRYMQFP